MTGYFPPGAPIRRIGAESVLMLGGGRALLMQAAHPLVAAGIVEHSDYGADPWKRLGRTLLALYTVVFGTREEADRTGAIVQAVHRPVRGCLREPVGAFAAGTPYAASDPELMLWVHATLVDTGLVMHEAFVGPLSEADREGFYQDMKTVARVFGTPAHVLPDRLADFEEYLRATIASLAVGADARAVRAVVLHPPVPLALRPGFRVLRPLTVGLLPAKLREAYGLRFGRVQRLALETAERSARLALVPLLPRRLRVVRGEHGGGIPLRVLTAFSEGQR